MPFQKLSNQKKVIPKEGIAELQNVDTNRKIYYLNTSVNKKVDYDGGEIPKWRKEMWKTSKH